MKRLKRDKMQRKGMGKEKKSRMRVTCCWSCRLSLFLISASCFPKHAVGWWLIRRRNLTASLCIDLDAFRRKKKERGAETKGEIQRIPELQSPPSGQPLSNVRQILTVIPVIGNNIRFSREDLGDWRAAQEKDRVWSMWVDMKALMHNMRLKLSWRHEFAVCRIFWIGALILSFKRGKLMHRHAA